MPLPLLVQLLRMRRLLPPTLPVLQLTQLPPPRMLLLPLLLLLLKPLLLLLKRQSRNRKSDCIGRCSARCKTTIRYGLPWRIL